MRLAQVEATTSAVPRDRLGPRRPSLRSTEVEPSWASGDGTSNLSLLTVGIDIGSSTTLFTVSRVELALVGSRYVPVERDVIFASDILLTPYQRSGLIGTDALRRFMEEQLAAARITPGQIDSGAVILTGNALERRNSRLVSEVFADLAGRFVVAAAGDDLEAMLSAFGSGAVSASLALPLPVLHIDVGGGTTKFAWCDNGKVTSTCAIRVGARVVSTDDDGRVLHVTESGKQILKSLRRTLVRGDVLHEEDRRELAAFVVDRIEDVIAGADTRALRSLMLTAPLALRAKEFHLSFGGGVSEYIYARETGDFGDLGPWIGDLLRRRILDAGRGLVETSRGIRSTVTGASQFTVQVTSQTVHISSEAVLPLRNIPIAVIDVGDLGDQFDSEEMRKAVIAGASAHGATLRQTIGIGLIWAGTASFRRLDAAAAGLVMAMVQTWSRNGLAVVVMDADIGGLVGDAVRRHLPTEIELVCVDGIESRHFDHIDIGPVNHATGVLPVVVKSLLFPSDTGEQAARSGTRSPLAASGPTSNGRPAPAQPEKELPGR